MINKSRTALAILNCLPLVVGLNAQQVTSALTGSVLDTAGVPVAGATVRLRRVPKTQFELTSRTVMRVVRAHGDVDFEVSATTNSAGIFSVANLPHGGYVACAEFAFGYVNNCEWTGGVVFTVPAATNPRITATPSAIVSVQVNDPNALLPLAAERPEAPSLLIGVLTKEGAYHRAAVTAGSGATRIYTVAVLPGRDVTVRAASAKFLLADPDGKPLPSEFVGTGANPTPGKPSAFLLVVTGVKQ